MFSYSDLYSIQRRLSRFVIKTHLGRTEIFRCKAQLTKCIINGFCNCLLFDTLHQRKNVITKLLFNTVYCTLELHFCSLLITFLYCADLQFLTIFLTQVVGKISRVTALFWEIWLPWLVVWLQHFHTSKFPPTCLRFPIYQKIFYDE